MGQSVSQPGSAGYQPSIADVFKIKRYLRSALPTELVDKIIDDASYWPHSSIYLERPLTVSNGDEMYMRSLPLGIPGTEGDFSLVEDDFKKNGAAWTKKLILGDADDSLCSRTLLHPCRKIEFQLWSHDQGWGGEHPQTYRASYTWFDAGIQNLQGSTFSDNVIEWPASLIFKQSVGEFKLCSIPTDPKPYIPGHTTLQRNIAAKRQTTEHNIVWHYLDSYDKDSAEAREAASQGRGPGTLDGKFVRSMQVGDCIILWARARFPGWANHVQKAKITVYWVV